MSCGHLGPLEACVSIRSDKLPPAAMESGRHAAWVTVLSPYVELNGELTRGSRKSSKGRGWRAEGRGDIVRVGEIPAIRGESPSTMTGAVFDPGAQQAIRTLSLGAVIERCVEDRRLRRGVCHDLQSTC